jgi:hypothetical protein
MRTDNEKHEGNRHAKQQRGATSLSLDENCGMEAFREEEIRS